MSNSRKGLLYKNLLACNNFILNKNKIKEVKTPFIIIAGSNDIMTSKNKSKILNDMLCNSRLEIINNVGHFHPLESPLECK